MVGYSELKGGMFIMCLTGQLIWQVFIVCNDRVIYKSTTTKTIRTLKRLKHSDKVFKKVELTEIKTVDYCPF